MRSITAIASCALLALPLVSLSAPARADSNDFMGQAKKFLNNDNNNNNDRNAYERGRQDELRRQQAQQDRNAIVPIVTGAATIVPVTPMSGTTTANPATMVRQMPARSAAPG